MDFEFDMETIAAIGLGIIGGVITLVVTKNSGAGGFWRVLTFAAATAAGYFVSRFIFSR